MGRTKTKEKIFPYVVYHLTTHDLMELERAHSRGDELSAEDVQRAQSYRAMTSCLVDMDDIDTENGDLREQSRAYLTARKSAAARALLKLDGYVEVAQVDRKNAQEAVLATTSVEAPWVESINSKLVSEHQDCRSTSEYDLILRFDEWFLVMPLGFISLESNEYATGLV